DTERRHRPTAWTVFGVGAAILAGDGLLALAQDLLLEDDTLKGAWAARCLSAAVLRLIGGQGADLAFEKRDDVTLAECLDMAGDLVVAAGGKDWAESEADAQLAAANASLASIDLAGDVRAELTAIAEFITARTW